MVVMVLLVFWLTPTSRSLPRETSTSGRGTPWVAVVRKPNCQVYEKVIEEFRGQVRATVRVIPYRHTTRGLLLGWLRRFRPRLVFVVGQAAYDGLRSWSDSPMLHAYVFHRQVEHHMAIQNKISPGEVFQAFRTARPEIKRIGVVYGPSMDKEVIHARKVAQAFHINLWSLRASSPAQAISLLRRINPRVQGIWLMTDLQILTPQVFQYALGVQFHHQIPLMGAVRRHVYQGALLSIDYNPHDVGGLAAKLANTILAGHIPSDTSPGKLRFRAHRIITPANIILRRILSVNRSTAKAIGVQISPFKALKAEIIR